MSLGTIHGKVTETDEEGPTPDNISLTMNRVRQNDRMESNQDRFTENIVDGPTPDDFPRYERCKWQLVER